MRTCLSSRLKRFDLTVSWVTWQAVVASRRSSWMTHAGPGAPSGLGGVPICVDLRVAVVGVARASIGGCVMFGMGDEFQWALQPAKASSARRLVASCISFSSLGV